MDIYYISTVLCVHVSSVPDLANNPTVGMMLCWGPFFFLSLPSSCSMPGSTTQGSTSGVTRHPSCTFSASPIWMQLYKHIRKALFWKKKTPGVVFFFTSPFLKGEEREASVATDATCRKPDHPTYFTAYVMLNKIISLCNTT